MSKSPYSDLPDHCFWRRTHNGKAPGEVDPVVSAGFRITPQMKIATAGSCFAQHIARHLRGSGYHYFVTETGHPLIHASTLQAMNYGTFSARFGNIYTTRQLLQLAQRAYGRFEPVDDVWEHKGAFVDPFRPNIQEGGFITEDELRIDRMTHLAAVRQMFEQCDVFVFTFGLTEAWRAKFDGAIYPLCPGTAGGEFDPEAHEFINFTVNDVVSDFSAFMAILLEVNPNVRVITTVSPVPLMATARADSSVITATTYSKAVLRVAAEMLTSRFRQVFYFPSYEVITGNHARGGYFHNDLRDVHPAGVAHVMRLFMKHYAGVEAAPEAGHAAPPVFAVPEAPAAEAPQLRGTPADTFLEDMARSVSVICDEELLDSTPNQGESVANA